MRKLLALIITAASLASAFIGPLSASAACMMQYPTIGTINSVTVQGDYTTFVLDHADSFDGLPFFTGSVTNIDAYNSLAMGFKQNGYQVPSQYVRPLQKYETADMVKQSLRIAVPNDALAKVWYKTGDIIIMGPPGGAACMQDGFTGFFGADGVIKSAVAYDSGLLSYTYGSETLSLSAGNDFNCSGQGTFGTKCQMPITYTVNGSSVTMNGGDTRPLAGSRFTQVSLVTSTHTTPPNNMWIEDFDPRSLVHVLSFSGKANGGVSATIDQSSLTTSNAQPTLTGTISGTSNLWVLIGTVGGGENDSGIMGTSQGNITVSGSTWSATLNASTLSPGNYVVHVYDMNQYGGKQNLLASGSLTVRADAGCASCSGIPFISSISPTSGPVGSRVTLHGSNFMQGVTKFLGSMIWGQPSYVVENNGTTLTFTVPSMAVQSACGGCQQQPGPTPILPGDYVLSLSNDGSAGQSGNVKFTVTSGTVQQTVFSVSPNAGMAPLSVGFTASGQSFTAIDFGDGSNMQAPLFNACPPGVSNCNVWSPTHTYQSVGNFTARLINGNQSVGSVSVVATSGSVVPSNPPPQTCPVILRNLSRGSHGNDIRALQQYFISTGVLGANSASGFFGPLTEGAVQEWQASHGLISSGSPSTTGWGVVGRRTRAALAHCDQ